MSWSNDVIVQFCISNPSYSVEVKTINLPIGPPSLRFKMVKETGANHPSYACVRIVVLDEFEASDSYLTASILDLMQHEILREETNYHLNRSLECR